MPQRNRAVDYPQVHPPAAQPQLGLAAPRSVGGHNRFSWQDAPNESSAGGGDAQFERGAQRQSSVPPLPVLPEHLAGAQEQQRSGQDSAEAVLPSQRNTLFQQQHQQQHQRQVSQFRPDIPRHFQQQQAQPATSIPSYEASQAAYWEDQTQNVRMQEQAVYPDNFNQSLAQFSTPALPMQHAQAPASEDYQSSEEKPEQQQGAQGPTRHGPHIQVGPDINPLMPSFPSIAVSPSNTTNIRSFPPSVAAMQFSQSLPYGQPHSTRGGTWHHGLGSCAEPTTCLSSLICPCMVYGRTQYRLSMKSAKKDPTNMLGYSSINGSCLAWSVLCGVNMLLTAIQHTRIRKAYEMEGVAGNIAGDCAKSICCCCCVIAQDEKEMKFREERGRQRDLTIEQGYASPENMTFGPPR